jgi:hypothetical protein
VRDERRFTARTACARQARKWIPTAKAVFQNRPGAPILRARAGERRISWRQNPRRATRWTAVELKDAWDVLSVTERLEGLRLLGLAELEDLFLSVPAHDQMQILLAATRWEARAWIGSCRPTTPRTWCRRRIPATGRRCSSCWTTPAARKWWACWPTPRTTPAA